MRVVIFHVLLWEVRVMALNTTEAHWLPWYTLNISPVGACVNLNGPLHRTIEIVHWTKQAIDEQSTDHLPNSWSFRFVSEFESSNISQNVVLHDLSAAKCVRQLYQRWHRKSSKRKRKIRFPYWIHHQRFLQSEKTMWHDESWTEPQFKWFRNSNTRWIRTQVLYHILLIYIILFFSSNA